MALVKIGEENNGLFDNSFVISHGKGLWDKYGLGNLVSDKLHAWRENHARQIQKAVGEKNDVANALNIHELLVLCDQPRSDQCLYIFYTYLCFLH